MPTLPLYTTPAHPDAWHRVIAPGGYEWWRFAADEDATGRGLVVDFFDGEPHSGRYRRAHARFRRRPTRVPPPVPRDYPCVRFRVWEAAETLVECTGHFPPGSFQGSERRPEVAAGPNSMCLGDDGVYRISLKGTSIEHGMDASVELAFRAARPDPPTLRQISSTDQSTTEHFQVVFDTEWDVSGRIELTSKGGVARVVPFQGSGRRDHRFGSGPMPAGW